MGKATCKVKVYSVPGQPTRAASSLLPPTPPLDRPWTAAPVGPTDGTNDGTSAAPARGQCAPWPRPTRGRRRRPPRRPGGAAADAAAERLGTAPASGRRQWQRRRRAGASGPRRRVTAAAGPPPARAATDTRSHHRAVGGRRRRRRRRRRRQAGQKAAPHPQTTVPARTVRRRCRRWRAPRRPRAGALRGGARRADRGCGVQG
ncbi:hypothetical protein BU14_0127s0035 [Porphyra umbilicalis]|uniref:Uncharacterized protein n=1 Tax=Porphyra umbilicalis TaxID=2786 RepID=A0A1X6PAQ3_PORUM|nr:hypothetical protein BU14_0127s0035 [Porphyra umbilicalis]|eukprot:OSX77938.1 hypothetical protein BU14_0127s0035 [Porphyra umbilicalis]